MSAKGDARPERQSSWAGAAPLAGLAAATRYVWGAFVVLVAGHLACEAYRARTDDALPTPGIEVQPGFVAARVVMVWLPFALLGVRELRRSLARRGESTASAESDPRERALSVMEPIALGVVLLFVVVHGVLQAWPLLRGTLVESEVRVELVAALSSTVHGVPALAVGYLCGVGAASFYLTRLALRLGLRTRPAFARCAVALGVLSYLLGSYAVIRCASGALLP